MEASLQKAVGVAGGPVALARALSDRGRAITSQAISQWTRVPAERALDVEAVTGVSRRDLRPDLWPDEEHSGHRPSRAEAAE